MHSWRNFVDKVKRYFPLERSEKIGLIATSLILGLIFFQYLSHYFKDWQAQNVIISVGAINLIWTIVFVVLALFVREIAHRTIAVWLGYSTKYKAWVVGLVVGLVISLISNGWIIFIAPGMLVITHLEIHRLGKGFYALSYKHLGWIAMSGSIATMLLAVILKSIGAATGSTLLDKAVMVCILMSIFDMIPVPPFNGSMTFFGSRFVYVFVLGALIGCAALLSFASALLAIIGALILGAAMLFVFFVYVDKRW